MQSSVSASGYIAPLRAAALTALVAGAIASVGFTLHAGRHNHSKLLMLLFLLWVPSPYVALALAHVFSARWPDVARAVLYSMMLVLSLASPIIYGEIALGPPRAQQAFAFVIVPPASWLAIAAVLLALWLSHRKRGRLNFPAR